MRAFSWNSVRVNPGHTQSTWTPVPRSSAAIASLKLSTNALVAPYVALYAIGPNAAIDAMFITEPRRRATMPGRQRPVNSTRASTFNRTSSSSCSTGSWSKRPPVPKPALFTSHSTVRPRRSTSASTAWTAPAWRRSWARTCASTPCSARSPSASDSSRSARRATSTSERPSRASRRASASPMPLDAPVTSATAIADRLFALSGGLRRQVAATLAFSSLWQELVGARLGDAGEKRLETLAEEVNACLAEDESIVAGKEGELDRALDSYRDALAGAVGPAVARLDMLMKAVPAVADRLRAAAAAPPVPQPEG